MHVEWGVDDPSQSLSTDFFVPRCGQSAYPYRMPKAGKNRTGSFRVIDPL